MRSIVFTGGPGAGKTAVLELAARIFGGQVLVVQEAASILFRGGFPRAANPDAQRALQRAIFHVQSELEATAALVAGPRYHLCDRGTLDGLAYWPGTVEDFFSQVGTTAGAQMARYHAVIHLRVPPASLYQRDSTNRPESHFRAMAIDERIQEIWSEHPRYVDVPHSQSFLDKANRALAALRGAMSMGGRMSA